MTLNAMIRSVGVAVIAVAASVSIQAAEIGHWSPNAGAANREFKFSTGRLVSWDWAGGVKFVDGANVTVTVQRDAVFSVRRQESDRSPELHNAINRGDVATLLRLSTAGRDDLEKEEALAMLAESRALGNNASGSADAWREYLKAYPRGNFALDARVKLADFLTNGPRVSSATVQEAEKFLEEAATLGGEMAKARASLALGHIAMGKKAYAAAYDRFTAGVEAATKLLQYEIIAQCYVGQGEASMANGNTANAKTAYAAALKTPIIAEYDRTIMGNTRGAAQMGIATIAGESLEGYQAWLSASCWYIGRPQEGQCLIKALTIAESMAAKDPAEWGERAKQVRETCRKIASAELAAYDKAKAG